MKTTSLLLALPAFALAQSSSAPPTDCETLTGDAAQRCYFGKEGYNTAAVNYLDTVLANPTLSEAFIAVGDVATNSDAAPTYSNGQIDPIAALTALLPGIPAASLPTDLAMAVSSVIAVGVSLQTAGPSGTGAAFVTGTSSGGKASAAGASASSGAASVSSHAAAAPGASHVGMGAFAGLIASVAGLVAAL